MLSRLPCWADLTPEQYRERIAELVEEIDRVPGGRGEAQSGKPDGQVPSGVVPAGPSLRERLQLRRQPAFPSSRSGKEGKRSVLLATRRSAGRLREPPRERSRGRRQAIPGDSPGKRAARRRPPARRTRWREVAAELTPSSSRNARHLLCTPGIGCPSNGGMPASSSVWETWRTPSPDSTPCAGSTCTTTTGSRPAWPP